MTAKGEHTRPACCPRRPRRGPSAIRTEPPILTPRTFPKGLSWISLPDILSIQLFARKMARFIMIFLTLLVCGVAEAMSRKTALTAELLNLGHFTDAYLNKNGRYPQTWEELEKIAPGLDSILSILKPTQRMVLIWPPIELPRKYGGGMALAITREPFRPQSWKEWPAGTTHEYLEDPSYAFIVRVNGWSVLRRVPPDDTRSIIWGIARDKSGATGPNQSESVPGSDSLPGHRIAAGGPSSPPS